MEWASEVTAIDLDLIQHAHARAAENPKRPLTDAGRGRRRDRDGFALAWAIPPDLA
jgi:hypothetical protein